MEVRCENAVRVKVPGLGTRWMWERNEKEKSRRAAGALFRAAKCLGLRPAQVGKAGGGAREGAGRVGTPRGVGDRGDIGRDLGLR